MKPFFRINELLWCVDIKIISHFNMRWKTNRDLFRGKETKNFCHFRIEFESIDNTGDVNVTKNQKKNIVSTKYFDLY